MAAAEYYNPGGGSLQVPHQAPRPQQHPPNHAQPNMSSLPYPVSDAPPPYSAYGDQQPRPNSQPPPQSRVYFQPSGYTPNPPPLSNQSQNGGYQYPPQTQGQAPPPNMYRPQGAPSPYPAQQPQGQAGYPYPNGISPARKQSNNGQRPLDDYDEDESRSVSRSRSRSRDRRRHHHHHHHGARPPMERKKRSGVSTFLGAGGGALIGDAIFPGLGTLGGAILGGVGGHEYDKQRRSYSNPSGGRERRYSDDGYDDVHGRGRRY